MKSKPLMMFLGIVCFLLIRIYLDQVNAQVTGRIHDPINQFSMQVGAVTENFSLAPNFTTQIRIKAGGSDMKVDTYTSVPCVVDWNGDGKKDLLVGCFYYGNVYLFLNSGTNASPVFSAGTKLKADGQEISVAYG